MTRAKFRCVSVAKREGWGGSPFLYSAEFHPVTGDSPENKEFFAATPSGRIEVSTVRADHFEVGKSYYVDFTEAP
jgi:hypothetical protein